MLPRFEIVSQDFTVANYLELLDLAKKRFRFVQYADSQDSENIAIWRHDIDISPHRALALAKLENEKGVDATYFVQLTSRFYNAMEEDVIRVLRHLSKVAHIGLHFDPNCYKIETIEDFCENLSFEINVLQKLIAVPVDAFSLHNPTLVQGITLNDLAYCGLINASAPHFREAFVYCSDSNGYWRYRTLQNVLMDEATSRVHALTHPCWWQEEIMPPRKRVARCVEGRAQASLNYYDNLLAANGRKNENS